MDAPTRPARVLAEGAAGVPDTEVRPEHSPRNAASARLP